VPRRAPPPAAGESVWTFPGVGAVHCSGVMIDTSSGEMRRSPAGVRGWTSLRQIAAMTLLAGVLTVSVSCGAVDYWVMSTWINETDVPVYVTNNNNLMTVLRPHEKNTGPGGFYRKGERGAPATYTIRAYEFLRGKGDTYGWDDETGKGIYGGPGDLIFTKTYTREEIDALNYTVTITQNMFPGQTQPPS